MRTLTSGSTLEQGIGPNGFPLRTIDRPRNAFSQLKELISNRRRATQRNLSLVDSRLRDRLPYSSFWRDTDTILYKVSMSLSSKDALRWNRAGAQLRKKRSDLRAHESANLLREISCYDFGGSKFRESLTLRSKNFSFDDSYRKWSSEKGVTRSATNLMLLLFFILGTSYEGVHLALWNYKFATNVELLLWRISGITLMSMPALTISVCITFKSLLSLQYRWRD